MLILFFSPSEESVHASVQVKKKKKPCAIAKLVRMFNGNYLIFVEQINLDEMKV